MSVTMICSPTHFCRACWESRTCGHIFAGHNGSLRNTLHWLHSLRSLQMFWILKSYDLVSDTLMELRSCRSFLWIFFETTGKNPFDFFIANIGNTTVHQIVAHFRV